MANAPIRLLVCDIDGTLVRRDKGLPEENVLAIRAARRRGLLVSLISARPAAGILPIAAELGLEGERFFDLVRWGDAVAVLGPLGYTNRCRFYPIPQPEIDKSGGKLVQNPEW